MTLKTLKDMGVHGVTTYDLMREAKKWVDNFDHTKFYDTKNMICKLCNSNLAFDDGFLKDGITPCKIARCRCRDNKDIIAFIKHFFNLEDDVR